MAGGREAILAFGDAPYGGDFRRHFGARQHAAVAGLGALAQLDLDHLDLGIDGGGGEFFGVEAAVRAATAEIAGAQFPDNVAAAVLVIGAVAALAGVMREAAEFGAPVERADRVGAERAETHGGDVEHAGRIGLRARRAADGDAERLAAHVRRRHGMSQPFEAELVGVDQRAEGALVELHLGALVDDGALRAAEGQAVGLALEEILPHLGPDMLQQEA